MSKVKTNISRTGSEFEATFEKGKERVSMGYDAETGQYRMGSEADGKVISLVCIGDTYKLLSEIGDKKTEVEFQLGDGAYNMNILEAKKERKYHPKSTPLPEPTTPSKPKKRSKRKDRITKEKVMKSTVRYHQKNSEWPTIGELASTLGEKNIYNRLYPLEEAGHIKRIKQKDKRGKVVVATAKGKKEFGLK